MDKPIQVGRYQVQRVLGKGAMGVVYLADDPQIGRRVALKTVKPAEGARPEELEESRVRFLREARAAGKLLHPNIVTIFDVFEHGGTLYIAMEYVEGVLLDAYCTRRNLLPIDQVTHLGVQALSALDYAHRAGVIHRDIKPGNLMVVEGQSLKVMDFGLARDAGASMSHSGAIIGTPHYMSPEQIQGKTLDGRSDLFSMGVVLYEMLTGERPFQGDTISTVMYRVLNEDPPPVRSLNPRVSEALSQVVRKAMAKSPMNRYPSAAALRAALVDPEEPDPVQTWVNLERPSAPPASAHPDAPYLPPISSKERASKRHTLSRKYARFAILAVLIVAGLYLGITRYVDYLGVKSAPIKPPLSQEILPVALEVATVPPGAQLLLDGAPVDAVTLAPNDTRTHTVEARLGCLGAKAQVTGASTREKLTLTLSPGPSLFPVISTPPGARILVDGTETGLQTPASLPRQDCAPFKLSLSFPDHDGYELEVDPTKVPKVEATLTPLASHGSLKVLYPGGILQVFEGDRAVGVSGKPLSLPPGEHTLRFVDRSLRGSREEKVTIRTAAEETLKVPAFPAGRVFLYGKPANDGKVMVDGSYLEDLPLNGTTHLAVGSHDFLVISPAGKRVAFAWAIRGGEQTRVVDFSKGRVETP
jgi:serine/threonine protein kinase